MLSRELGDKRSLAFCLEGLADIACACAASEEAARLLGAAEALRKAIGSPLPQIKRAGYERCTAALRAALGDEDFHNALILGRGMNVEQAIAVALK